MAIYDDGTLGSLYDACRANWPERPDELEKEWTRYEDYYDGRPVRLKNETYFPRQLRETSARYADRPKLIIPLCRAIVDLHAGALVGDCVKTTVAHAGTQKIWNEIDAWNNANAFAKMVSNVQSVYGSGVVVARKWDDGSDNKQIEFEVYPPNRARPLYDSGAAGRSVRHIYGVQIRSLYDTRTGQLSAYSRKSIGEKVMSMLGAGTLQERIEFISEKRWVVWLDGNLAPKEPKTGSRWMPRDDGSNPFGKGAVLFNNLETHEGVLGQSDIRVACYDNENLNHLFSDIIYATRMYVPILAMFTDNEDTQIAFKAGIGAGIGLNRGDDMKFVSPPDALIEKMLEPFRVQLELLYSNAKAPGVAVGLGHLFGGEANVSGRSKELEYRPTVKYAEQRFPAFQRAWTEMVRLGLTVAKAEKPFGQAKPANVDAPISVSIDGEIVPTTMQERIETEGKAVLYGMRSLLDAVKNVYRYDDEKAAESLDLIYGEMRRRLLGLPYKRLMEAIAEQQEVKITPEETEADVATIFSPAPIAAADAADEDTPEEIAAREAAGAAA